MLGGQIVLRLALVAAIVSIFLPRAAHAAWFEIRTPHFIIYSEGSEKSVRDYASSLERFDKALRLLHGLGDRTEDSNAEVMAGTLAGDFLLILDHLREWDEGGVWALAYAR